MRLLPFLRIERELFGLQQQSVLLRFDPVTEKIEKYGQKDGLPSNQINSIIEDLSGKSLDQYIRRFIKTE